MLNFCKLQVNFNYHFSKISSAYKCTEFSVGGGGQFLGMINPDFALYNNDIKDNEL